MTDMGMVTQCIGKVEVCDCLSCSHGDTLVSSRGGEGGGGVSEGRGRGEKRRRGGGEERSRGRERRRRSGGGIGLQERGGGVTMLFMIHIMLTTTLPK